MRFVSLRLFLSEKKRVVPHTYTHTHTLERIKPERAETHNAHAGQVRAPAHTHLPPLLLYTKKTNCGVLLL